MSDDDPGLVIERDGAVGLVRLVRPARRNALDEDSRDRLSAFLDEAQADPAIRAIVITGHGRDFCTGADVVAQKDPAGAMTPLDFRYASVGFQRFFQQLWEVDVPVVSAVNGSVAGAGWMLALLADLVVAAEGVRWTHVFARRGMIPHAGDPYFLPRIIPFHRLNEIALLSDPVTSDTLHSWGVVNRCVPVDEVLPTALALAHRLAEGPTRSLAMAKRLYRRSLDSDITTAMEAERNAQALISTTTDRQEGLKSFLEGRTPTFIGD